MAADAGTNPRCTETSAIHLKRDWMAPSQRPSSTRCSPHAPTRRVLLRSVGAATLMAAIADAFPLATSQAIAQQAGPLEKTKLNIGFVPITCTVPILLAQAAGEYQKEGWR